MQKLIEFESGLRLVFIQNDAVRSVATGVFVGAGAVTETPELSGISHFIEHMTFKGTVNRSAFDIVNEIDKIGAQINAFTTKSHTCYYTVSLDTNVRKCAEVLSDLYFNPTFEKSEFEKERRVILEEISESEDTPDDLCMDLLSSAFFRAHPLGKPILGTEKTLAQMTPEILREYKNKHYVPANTVISIAGNLTEKEAVAITEEFFEKNCNRIAHSERERVKPAQIKGGFRHRKKEIEQVHIAFAFPSVPYDDDRGMAVQLLASVFGMEMSSRLFQSVREKLGLCYTIMGYPSAYENNGSFIIYTSTNPKSVEKAVKAIREEIDTLLEGGITGEELEKGKQQLKTSLVLGQESTSSMMRAFGRHAAQTGRLYDIDKRLNAIDSLTAEDIRDVARFVFDFEKVAGSLVGRDTSLDIVKLIKGI